MWSRKVLRLIFYPQQLKLKQYMAESALEDWIVDFKEELWLSDIEFFHFIINNKVLNWLQNVLSKHMFSIIQQLSIVPTSSFKYINLTLLRSSRRSDPSLFTGSIELLNSFLLCNASIEALNGNNRILEFPSPYTLNSAHSQSSLIGTWGFVQKHMGRFHKHKLSLWIHLLQENLKSGFNHNSSLQPKDTKKRRFLMF
jgi:hypothetical protein